MKIFLKLITFALTMGWIVYGLVTHNWLLTIAVICATIGGILQATMYCFEKGITK